MCFKSAIFCSFILLCTVCQAEPLKLNNEDKEAHMLGSYALTFTAAQILKKKDFTFKQQILYSTLITLAAGLLKETVIDSRFSRRDMYANGIGIVGGIAFTWAIEDLF